MTLRKAVTPSPIEIAYCGASGTSIMAPSGIVSRPIARGRSTGRDGAHMFLTGNGCVSFTSAARELVREYVSVHRQPFERTILTTATLGTTFPTSMHVRGLIDGEKMVLPGSPIIANACVWRSRCGTARITSSRSAFLASLVIKVIMARTSKNSTGISTRHQHTPT
jgi:hypothetical protein